MEINTNYPKIAAYSCDEPLGKLVVPATIRRGKTAADTAVNGEVLAFDARPSGVGERR